MIAADITVDSGSPAAHADDSERLGFVGIEVPSPFQPITRRVRGVDQGHQLPEITFGEVNRALKRLQLMHFPTPTYAAHADHATQQPVSGKLFVQTDQFFT